MGGDSLGHTPNPDRMAYPPNFEPFASVFENTLSQENKQKGNTKVHNIPYEYQAERLLDSSQDQAQSQQESEQSTSKDHQESDSDDRVFSERASQSILFNLTPITTHFIGQLPGAVSQLIEETIQVIRSYKIGRQEVRFKFQNLQLEIRIAKVDEILAIQVTSKDPHLKDSLLNKETQKAMLMSLQDAFPDIEIQLEIIDETLFEQGSEGHASNDDEQQDNPKNEGDEASFETVFNSDN